MDKTTATDAFLKQKERGRRGGKKGKEWNKGLKGYKRIKLERREIIDEGEDLIYIIARGDNRLTFNLGEGSRWVFLHHFEGTY
jgi:hypothetical protein